jgi:co-chaperonin GroES (HSP10)
MTVKVQKVLGDRILLRKDMPPKRGIILTSKTEANERLQTATGTVIGIGPLAFKDAEMRDIQSNKTDGTVVTERAGQDWVEVGERVLYQRYSGARVPDPTSDDGYVPELVFIQYRDLICTLEKETEEANNV